MAHLPTRHGPAEPPPPCLQSTESRIPIPIANDVLGTVIGRDFNPEFANHMTMSGSQALIQLVGPSASVLAMGTNPVAIWGADGSTCTLLRRGERSRLLFNGDRISLVAQPTGQVDAGCTYTFVLDDQQLQETDEALKAPLKVLTPGAVPTLAAKTSVPKLVRKFGRQRAALAGPSAAAVDDITGSDTFEPMEPDFNLFCLQSGIPLPTDAYLSRFEELLLPWLEELEAATLTAICDEDNVDYEAAEAEDVPALAARIRASGGVSKPALIKACHVQGLRGNRDTPKSELLARLQGAETRYRGASADGIRAQVALLTSSRRRGLLKPKGCMFAYPEDVTCLVIGAHPSLERESITCAKNSRTIILDQLMVALTAESEERVEELLDGFETGNISITGDQSSEWLIYDALRCLIRIGERAFEASNRGKRLAVVFLGKLAELLRQVNLDPMKMFDPTQSRRLGFYVEHELEATRTFPATKEEEERRAWGPKSLMTFAQSTLQGRSVASIRVVDGDQSVVSTAGWLWHPNYIEGSMAASIIDRPMSLWRDVLSGRPRLPEMTLDLRELRSLLKKTKPKEKAVDTKRAKKAAGSSRGVH